MKLPTVSIAIAMAMAAVPAHAQILREGTVAHRVAAGTPDASGWVRADSTEGAFSVTLPCRFNDLTFNKPTSADAAIGGERMFALACDRADKVRFFAARTAYRDETEAQLRFGGFPGDKVRATTREGGAYRGQASIDATFADDGRCASMRVVRAGRDNLLMIVEPIDTPCVDLTADAAKFFDSLEIKAR